MMPAYVVHRSAPAPGTVSVQPLTPPVVGGTLAEMVPPVPTTADVLTLAGYGLGLAWCLGGPTWMGLVSILLDELDGRVARALNQSSERGSALDWGADVTLTSFASMRLGQSLGSAEVGVAASLPLLYLQAHLRGKGIRPTVGSMRALLMLATMAIEHTRK